MEENNDIDKLARSAMDVFKRDVPENAWKQLDAELDKRQALMYKKKANWFRWLSICLGLLLFFSIIYRYTVPVQELITMKDSGKSTQEGISENLQPADKIITGSTLKGNDTKVNPGSAGIAPLKNTQAGLQIPGKDLSAAHHAAEKRNISGDSKGHHASNVDGKSTLTMSGVNGIRRNIKRNVNQTRHATAEIKKDGSNFPRDDQSKIVNVKEVVPASNEFETVPVSAEEMTLQEAPASGSISPEAEKQTTESALPSPVPAIQNNLTAATPQAVDSAVKKKSTISHFSIGAFYSPEHTWINLKGNNAGDDLSVYYAREKFESSYTTGLMLSYDLSSKWSIVSGCTYSEKKFTMTYSAIYVGYGFDGDLHFQYPTSWGIVEKPNTTNKVLHEGDVFNKTIACSQVIRFISVPLIARYKITGKRLQWFAEAGVTANILNHVSMDLTLAGTTSTIDNNIDGLKKINYGYVAGTGANLILFRGFGVFAEPVFRGCITSITKNISVDSYPWSLGLNAGIRFQPFQ